MAFFLDVHHLCAYGYSKVIVDQIIVDQIMKDMAERKPR
jgi:hypothetical protein